MIYDITSMEVLQPFFTEAKPILSYTSYIQAPIDYKDTIPYKSFV